MDNLNLKDLNISKEDSRDIIELLAKKRNIKNYKRKSNDKLSQAVKENKTPKTQSKHKKRKKEKYRDHDDYECKGIKDIKDLFKLSIDEDHYKPILVKSGYNKNYAQCESKGDRILTIQEYLV